MSFANREHTIPAYGSVTFDVKASAFNVLHADLPVNVGFDNGSETERVEQGLGIPVLGGFEKIRFVNPNATDVFIRVAFNHAAIIDNRLTASSDLKVIDPGGGGESFADVVAKQAEMLAMMQNANDQRAGLLVAGDNFIFSAPPVTPVMLIDPANNMTGAVLRTFTVYRTSYVSVHQDAVAPSGWADVTKRNISTSVPQGQGLVMSLPLFVPSGQGVWVSADSSTGYFSSTWDYLP